MALIKKIYTHFKEFVNKSGIMPQSQSKNMQNNEQKFGYISINSPEYRDYHRDGSFTVEFKDAKHEGNFIQEANDKEGWFISTGCKRETGIIRHPPVKFENVDFIIRYKNKYQN